MAAKRSTRATAALRLFSSRRSFSRSTGWRLFGWTKSLPFSSGAAQRADTVSRSSDSRVKSRSLPFWVISVTASFVAAYLSACRSAYYALAYACNDLTLLGLWISAALTDVSCVPMVACMSVFFFNDIYGYVSWKARRQRQGG